VATLLDDFESYTAGAALDTVTNSPDHLATVSPGAGGTITADNTDSFNGTQSALLTPASAGGVTCLIALDTVTVPHRFSSWMVKFGGNPSTATQFAKMHNANGAVIQINPTGTWQFRDPAGGLSSPVSVMTFSASTWYRCEFTQVISGYVKFAVFLGAAANPIELWETASGWPGTGSTALNSIQLGKLSSGGTWAAMHLDDVFTSQDVDLPQDRPIIFPAFIPQVIGQQFPLFMTRQLTSTPDIPVVSGLTQQSLTASVGFSGASNTFTTLAAKIAALNLSGAISLWTARALVATLSFVGAQTRAIRSGQVAALSFTGVQLRRVTHGLTATVSFVGATTRAVVKGALPATLSFTGTLPRQTSRTLTAAVSFTGAVATAVVHHTLQSLSATLSFTGAQTHQIAHGLTAAVSFTTARVQRITRGVAGAVSFTGAVQNRTSRVVTATLSFTTSLLSGNLFRRTLTATVSFTGSVATLAVHFFTQALSATVGFTTSSFHKIMHAATATVGFTTAQTRQARAIKSGAVGFTTNTPRAIVPSALKATLSFTGVITRRVSHALIATLSFTGLMTAGRIFGKALTATVGFTVSMFKRVSTTRAASVGFSVVAPHALRTAFTATISLVSNFSFVATLKSALSVLRIRTHGRSTSTHATGTEPSDVSASRMTSTRVVGAEPNVNAYAKRTTTGLSGEEEGT
jgi:hypothetical protein